jgi:hypothetical protein
MNRSNPRFNLRNLEENLQNMMENILENYLNPSNANPTNGVQVPVPVPVPVQAPTTQNMPTQPRPVPMPNINNRNQRYVDQMAILHTLREIVNAYSSNTREYSSNMREYNSNFHEYSSNIDYVLQILRTMYQESNDDSRRPQIPDVASSDNASSANASSAENTFQPTTGPSTSTRPSTSTGPNTRTGPSSRTGHSHCPICQFSNVATQPNITANASPSRPTTTTSASSQSPLTAYYTVRQIYNFPLRETQEDVIVRLTTEQINRATETLVYSSDMIFINTQCPISLDEFSEGEPVRRISHCGHTFREAAINRWFETNVRCPVCRHDIRDISNNIPNNINEPDNIIDNSNGDVVNNSVDIQSFREGMYNRFNNNILLDDPIMTVEQNITLPNPFTNLYRENREHRERRDFMIEDYRIEVSMEDMEDMNDIDDNVEVIRDVSGVRLYDTIQDASGRTLYRI